MGCINSKKEQSTNPWSRSVWKSRGRKSRRVAPAMKTCYPHDRPGTTAGKRGPPTRETTSSTVNTVHSTVVMVREITENTIYRLSTLRRQGHFLSTHIAISIVPLDAGQQVNMHVHRAVAWKSVAVATSPKNQIQQLKQLPRCQLV